MMSIPNNKALNLHWYVHIKNRESGPYSYPELLSMAYHQDITAEDFVTYRGLGQWHKLNEFQNFTSEHIHHTSNELQINMEDPLDPPFRRNIRLPIHKTCLVVLSERVFHCECLDLSVGGCLVKLPRGKIKPEQKVKLHLYAHPKTQFSAFNLKGEATRVVPASKLNEGSDLYDLIGIRFFELKKEDREKLQTCLRNLVFKTPCHESITHVLARCNASMAA